MKRERLRKYNERRYLVYKLDGTLKISLRIQETWGRCHEERYLIFCQFISTF